MPVIEQVPLPDTLTVLNPEQFTAANKLVLSVASKPGTVFCQDGSCVRGPER